MRYNISSHGAGFRLSLGNGFAVSVQFTGTHYCENRIMAPPLDYFNRLAVPGGLIETGVNGCPSAEVAVIKPCGSLLDLSSRWGDSVKGYVKPDELVGLLQEVSTWSEDDIPKLESSDE